MPHHVAERKEDLEKYEGHDEKESALWIYLDILRVCVRCVHALHPHLPFPLCPARPRHNMSDKIASPTDKTLPSMHVRAYRDKIVKVDQLGCTLIDKGMYRHIYLYEKRPGSPSSRELQQRSVILQVEIGLLGPRKE